MIAPSVAKLKMFSPESEIFRWIKPKKKKKLFYGKFGSMPTFRSTQKFKKCFFVTSLRLSDHKVLHNIASSSSFFRFRSDVLVFSLIFRTSSHKNIKCCVDGFSKQEVSNRTQMKRWHNFSLRLYFGYNGFYIGYNGF